MFVYHTGTYCSNTNITKPLPSIPKQMTFNVEYRPEMMNRNDTNRWFVTHYKVTDCLFKIVEFCTDGTIWLYGCLLYTSPSPRDRG